MILYGSIPSPYVRRIRMLLDGQDYQFQPINLYEDKARAEYAKIAPIQKMPMLEDNGQKIFDSHVIAQYIQQKLDLPAPSIEELNLVSAVDAVTDSLIILFYGKKSELDVSNEKLIFKLQLGRIPVVLTWLNTQAELGAFNQWNYASLALISMLDWANFRDLYDFSDYPALAKARHLHANNNAVKNTMPE